MLRDSRVAEVIKELEKLYDRGGMSCRRRSNRKRMDYRRNRRQGCRSEVAVESLQEHGERAAPKRLRATAHVAGGAAAGHLTLPTFWASLSPGSLHLHNRVKESRLFRRQYSYQEKSVNV